MMTTQPPRPASQPDDARLTVRVAAYGLILQGLLERLMLAGVLDARDLDSIEHFAVTISGDLARHGSTEAQVSGARIADEIHQYMTALR
jgi:hypothetical protein